MKTAIECKGIKKSYGKDEMLIEALKGVSLEIYTNQLTLLVGPSGSGKSTLLSIITNILTPDEGQLFLLGQDVSSMAPDVKAQFCQEHLGIIFQSLFLIPSLNVVENVSLPLLIKGYSESDANKKSIEMLKKVNMSHRYNSVPSHLSKGQQQRVAIARAMVNEPQIIICDEPTSALDYHAGIEVMNLLKDIAKQTSKAVLVVTHDHRIFSYADRIIYLNDGQITSGENL